MRGSQIATAGIVLIVWIILSPYLSLEYLLAGIVLSSAVGIAFGRFAMEEVGWNFLSPRRWFYFMVYLLVLLRGILLAGVLLASTILRREMVISPGVVAIPTNLKKRWELTLLANSITLTPGTFFLDLDEDAHVLYVHWISIRSEDVADMRRMITESYERILSKVFE
jgi:multicomponent Na+:H+ antiporter subunit E